MSGNKIIVEKDSKNWLVRHSKLIGFICLIIWIIMFTIYHIDTIEQYNDLVDDYKEVVEENTILKNNCNSFNSIVASNPRFGDEVVG